MVITRLMEIKDVSGLLAKSLIVVAFPKNH